jgi:hypothetical protein
MAVMGAFRRVRAARQGQRDRRVRYPANLPIALALVLAAAGSTAPSIGREPVHTTPASAPAAASVTVISPQRYPEGLRRLPPAIHVAATGTSQGATRVAVAEVLLKAYRAAAAGAPPSCHLPASLLAAIGEVESGSLAGRTVNAQHRTSILGPVLNGSNGFRAIPDTDNGRLDGNRTWDRAVGPLQFIPSTWRTFGVDGDGDGTKDPQDVEDATATAANYLCYGGRDLSNPASLRSAVFAYNASSAYQQLVLTYQKRFASFGLDARTTVVGLSIGAPGGPVAGQVEPGVFTDPSGAPTSGPKRHHAKTTHKTTRADHRSTRSATPTAAASGGSSSATGKPTKPKPTRPASSGTSGSGTHTPSSSPTGGASSPPDDETTCPPVDPSTTGDPSADPSANASADSAAAADSSGDDPGETATCPPCGTTDETGTDPSATPTPTADPAGDGGDPTADPADPATCEPVTDPSASAAP